MQSSIFEISLKLFEESIGNCQTLIYKTSQQQDSIGFAWNNFFNDHINYDLEQ